MLNRTRKGLTLLELIVVIVILGILSAIAIPTFLTLINDSKYQAAATAAAAIDDDANGLAGFDEGKSTPPTSVASVDPEAPATDSSNVTETSTTGGQTYFVAAADESSATVVQATASKYTVTVGGDSVCYTVASSIGASGTYVDGGC